MPVLAGLLAGAGLKFVDVGGRGAAVPQLLPFAPVADYFTCEPDAREAERLRETLAQEVPWRSVTVITDAIAGQEGSGQLYLTANPGMGSLLPPDPEVVGRFCLARDFEYSGVATVPTTRLDTAAARYGFEDACFLKLDTQGTELEILQSGPRLLGSVMGIYVEALFHPFYKGQSLFADIDAFLRAEGFGLFGLYRTLLRRHGYRKDAYSRRVPTWAHCLYLREADPGTADATVASRRLAQQIMLALAFKHFDVAAELAARAAGAGLPDGEPWTHVAEEVRQSIEAQTERLVRKQRRKAEDPDPDAARAQLLNRAYRDNRYAD